MASPSDPKDRHSTDDPREAGGSSMDAGDPHSMHTVLYDTRMAILPREFEFSVAHGTSSGKPTEDVVALVIRGRINRPPDDEAARVEPAEPVEHLHLMPWEAAADIVVDLQALAARYGNSEEFRKMLEEKWNDLASQGMTEYRPIDSEEK